MKTNTICWMLLFACVFLGLSSYEARAEELDSVTHSLMFDQDVTKHITVKYLLNLPKGYGETDRKWPLILFLHGLKVRGDDPERIKEQYGPPVAAEEQEDFPFIVLSPQCPRGENWSNEKVLALLDSIVETYAVDETRIYVTGLSLGGYAAWSLAADHPGRFAALAPVCGGGTRLMAYQLRNMPIWAFHNEGDPTVPVEESKRMIELIQARNNEAKLTVYPKNEHNAWDETYHNPELYAWFLEHVRR